MAQHPNRDSIGDDVHALSTLLLDNQTLEDTLQHVSQLAVRTIPGCEAAGMTIFEKGKPTTAGATDEWVLAIDKHQYSSKEGPCLDAARTGKVVESRDIPQDARWKTFTERAAKDGLMSSLSIPLQVRGETLGALNLYSKTLSAFEGTGAANADLFGEHAAVAVANAYTFANALRLSENLKEALKSRELIGEAKGILMAREGVTEDEAFEMLRRASQRANLKLRDIAQELVNKIEARKPLGEPTDASSDE